MKSSKLLAEANLGMAELPDVEDNNNVGESWANRPRENEYDDVLKTYGCEQRRLFNAFDENDHRYDGNKVSTKEIFNHEQMQDLYTIRQIRGKGNSNQNGIEDNEDDANDFRLIEVNTDNDVSDNDYEMNEDDEAVNSMTNDEGEITIETIKSAENDDSLIHKGESIRLQLNLYDRLMHLQIKLHAALRVFNQLPRGMLAISLLRSVDRETKRKYLQVRKRTASMISTLLAIEELMLEGSNQTKNISSGKNISEIEDSENEKITSSEDEKSDEDDPTSRENHKSNSKNIDGPCLREKKSFKFFKMLLNERHDRFQNFRNSTLSKWDERTRLIGNFSVKNAKKDFSGFESLILKQIENIMRDKYRLVKRTQLKRSDVDRIGSDAEITYDVEIFDDDDFYQQLLKDIIEKKTAQIDDPVYMSRRWLEIENLRQKRSKKKKVDTKASKGRRIRYLVIPQLVNYYPSMPESVSWSHEMRNQLMKSLFVSDSQIYRYLL